MSATHMRFGAEPPAVPMLRWVFRRDGREMTCEIDAHGYQSYHVHVVPHWDVSSAVTERFDHPLGAMERHAGIARRLRERGWVVVDHVIPDHAGIAA